MSESETLSTPAKSSGRWVEIDEKSHKDVTAEVHRIAGTTELTISNKTIHYPATENGKSMQVATAHLELLTGEINSRYQKNPNTRSPIILTRFASPSGAQFLSVAYGQGLSDEYMMKEVNAAITEVNKHLHVLGATNLIPTRE